ncbi:a5aa6083-812d-42e1-ab7e-3839c7a40701 [Thermothielavioides terrestris]|jgi:ubiquinone/menaquinone biosynthesis C-methylase UbiE|uniref:A5aa6083-812d-42e1-ab7e-3839c7a40701 n=1 Tax=Thermothielavioides terrestris TaxID=2587410 RepID=A0A446BUQ7_9PEZI|nr:a5aa6083-812d-42e1-ab7e-3839c7a40701 [Thermothielavioides terrestris]
MAAPNPPPDLKPRLKEAYDSISTAYEWTQPHHPLRMNYTTELLKLLRKYHAKKDESGNDTPSLAGMHALELGCGSGVPVMEILLAKDMDVIGVDLSGAQIALAAHHFPNHIERHQLVLAEKDMMTLTYPPDEFDAVVALYSICHLPRDEQRVMLERVERWLKPGGMFLMNFPAEEMEGKVKEHWLGQEKGWMYWSAWGEEKMLEIIKELKFEILLQEVISDPGADATFLWVIARKTGGPAQLAKFED